MGLGHPCSPTPLGHITTSMAQAGGPALCPQELLPAPKFPVTHQMLILVNVLYLHISGLPNNEPQISIFAHLMMKALSPLLGLGACHLADHMV